MADKPVKPEKVRKAEATVKGLVKKEGELVKSDNAAKAAKADKVSAAAKKVKSLVSEEGALVKSDNALKAAKAASQEEGILSKVSKFAGRAGETVRGGLRAARGKAGPLGTLAIGASVAMEAGHALDVKLAEKRASTPDVKDDKSLGPRRNGASVAAKESTFASGSASKATPKADDKPAPKAAAPEKKADAKPSTTSASKKGAYPTYDKKSSTAGEFRSAFAAARKAGKGEFTWQGRKYNTKLKGK